MDEGREDRKAHYKLFANESLSGERELSEEFRTLAPLIERQRQSRLEQRQGQLNTFHDGD